MAGRVDAERVADDSPDAPAGARPAGKPTRALRRKFRLWKVIVPVLLVVVGVVGWGVWQVWQFGQDLLGLRDVAAQAQQHVRDGELAALPGDVERARNLAARADAAADDPAVAFAAGLPRIGDDITIARELAGVADDLGAATTSLDPLLARIADGEKPGLSMAADALDVLGPVRTAADAAAARLDALDLSGLELPVGDDIAQLRDVLGTIGPAADAISPYLDAFTILASGEEQHTWFVALQNLGEARPSGGLIGGWVLLRSSGGHLEVLDRGSNDVLHNDYDYTGFLPEGYEQLWGATMSTWGSLNMSANFPDNARLFAHAWNHQSKVKADGVLALGTGTAGLLGAATGPVEVDGRTIAPADLGDYLRVGVYQEYPNALEKDAAVASIVGQIFTRLAAGDLDLPGLFAAAAQDTGSDYLQLWSSDPGVQQQVEAAGLSGEFGDEPGPIASVRLADGAANKMDSFVHLGAEYRLGACTVDDGGVATRSSTFVVTLRNDAPDGLPEYVTGNGDLLDGQKHSVGSSRDFVVVYTPTQATLTSATLDGQPALVQTAWVGQRQLLVIDVKLEPGASSTIELGWDEFPTDSNDQPFTLTPTIVLPPLANPAESRLVDGPPCG